VISNRRLLASDDAGIAFRWKDYRADGPAREDDAVSSARVHAVRHQHFSSFFAQRSTASFASAIQQRA
jgi:hypothetical protein